MYVYVSFDVQNNKQAALGAVYVHEKATEDLPEAIHNVIVAYHSNLLINYYLMNYASI